MWRLCAITLLLLALGAAPPAAALDDLPPLPAEQEARYRALIAELRCLVCQNQTIADSSAPLAADLRKQVHGRIAQGETDEQIRRYVTDRYGDFVLYRPPFHWKTALLWLGPFLLVLVALTTALFYMHGSSRGSRRAGDAAADGEALRRLLKEEMKDETPP